ncbi:hypothetical protein VPH35_017448 [Triticum aestivum]
MLDVPEPQVPYIYMVAQHLTWSSKFCLCFNPAVPSRFVVFAFVERGHTIVAVRVYSSDTGEWTSKESGRHIVEYGVNTDGDTWRRIPMPPQVHFVRGHLYGLDIEHVNDCMLSVWVLKDYASGMWTLKHTASILKLLGRSYRELGEQYMVAAVHPECNLIFLVGWMRSQETLMSYDMDSQKLHVICTLDDYQMSTLRPYIPCFAEWPPSNAH